MQIKSHKYMFVTVCGIIQYTCDATRNLMCESKCHFAPKSAFTSGIQMRREGVGYFFMIGVGFTFDFIVSLAQAKVE